MITPTLTAPRDVRRRANALSAVTLVLGLHALAGPARAQAPTSPTAAVSIRADWLQANAMPLGRSALPSASVALERPWQDWSFEIGWLRAARALSTVQGGFVSASWPLWWGDALFLPGLGAFGGSSEASRDTTGYNWVVTSATDAGHVARYDHSRALTFGAGALLAFEYPARSPVGFRASVAQWMFSGQPLTGDRQRLLVGAGIAVRFGGERAAPRAPARTPAREGAP